ncbi:DUF6011 domain-containing protein [Streptomyces sp. NPDC056242]|uniref:DUF6011 domain-containing protein n=1 Tax=Streptomyces sp. NPDC056242 TaxID=3345760 RepID=UPI0035DC0E0C
MLCGRLLRDEASRARHFGPRCFKRLQRLLKRRPYIAAIPPIRRTIPGQLALSLDPHEPPPKADGRPIHDVPTGNLL